MWYRNFIVFVIFVVVDETISGKVVGIIITMTAKVTNRVGTTAVTMPGAQKSINAVSSR
jgi:hypothetical protein